MSRVKAGINIAKAGKTKISELVKKLKQRKYAKKHRKNLERAGRSAKSVSRYNIRAADQNVTVIPTKGQSQKGSSFRTHKVRGTGPGSRVGFESRASWRDEMDRMFGEIPIETFFKKKSKGGINTIMNKKYLTGGQAKMDKNNNGRIDAQDFKILKAEKAKGRGQGLQDEKVKPGKVMKAKRGTGLDFPVINKVKINKKSLHKNLMRGKNPYSDLVKTTEKGPTSFIERRKELGGRAMRAAKATKYGKIAAGVAGVGLAAKAYLNKKLEEAKAKRKKMGGGMIKRYNRGGGADSAEKRDIRKTESMIGDSISSKREQGRKDASYSRPKEADNIIKAGQRDAGKRIKPKKAALGMLMLGKAAKKDKKMVPGGIGITAAKASAIKKILGMRTGQMVKARGCKLGRTRPTKIT
jgi:hypothetical protein